MAILAYVLSAIFGAVFLFFCKLFGVVFERVLDDLASAAYTELLNFFRREGLEEKVDKLSKMLSEIEAMLDDAEEKQDNRVEVKKCLDDLRDLAYDADDVLDKCATEALRRKVMGGDDQASTSKGLKRMFDSLITGFTPGAVLINTRRLKRKFDSLVTGFSPSAVLINTRRLKRMFDSFITGFTPSAVLIHTRRLKRKFDSLVTDFSPSAVLINTRRLKRKFDSLVTGFTQSEVLINWRLGSEMEGIIARFNKMVKQKDNLKLSENVGRRSSTRSQTVAPTSVVTEAHVFGREKDKEDVLEFLVGKKRSDAQLSVLPIIGMGGMGKTTLAQLVYNDEQVQSFFELKAWTCVSEDFDAVRVTKTVLQFFSSANCEGKDLSWLQERLKENLRGKKFLVVLDDLWNEKYNDWTHLRAPFEAGAPGSVIVITTRNEEVTLKTGTIPSYRLIELSNDDCLSILAHHALGPRDFSAHLNLKDIGEELSRRCKGSPLAAKVLGGALRNKVDRDEWEDVLNSNIWDITGVKNEIAPALMLSYHHLPSHLKMCFAYCSILPKDYEFKEKQLVLLWMAEGLIKSRKGGKQMEDLGREDFRNLLSRSFFQQSFNKESRFVMHDLINDLAQQVAGDICFRMEDKVGGNNEGKPSRKARHSSYLAGKYDFIKKFEVFNDLICLRTFMPFNFKLSYGDYYLTRNVPFKLLPKLRRLRVLSLKGYKIYELPESIGDLKHLRFLNLSNNKIRCLPESVGTLYNLQTLILKNCFSLKKLPSTFGNLLNLRHLNIQGARELEGMPPQISKLTSLRTLPHLIVGKDSCSGVKLLGPLLHLRDTLCISRLENVINPGDARDTRLFEKKNLSRVSFEWSENMDVSHDRAHELQVLNKLQPHEGLKELTICNYGGTEFPMWLKVPSFSNMVLLIIGRCAKCTSLPAVGKLPSLKEVIIYGMGNVKNIGREFYGEDCSQPFRSLETLHFDDMQEWENWSPCGEFPKLHKLSITECPKLMGKLPNNLPLLENIFIDRSRQLVVSISSFPKLRNIKIEGSKGVVCGNKVDFKSLFFSSLSTISEFTCQIEEFTMGGLTNVEDLTIEQCEELTNLRLNDVELLQHLPSKLREIGITGCKALESLPKAMMDNSMHLEEVYIYSCSSLTHFAIGQLPPTLKQLKIRSCDNMQILVDGDDINKCGSSKSLLEYLDISWCSSLKFLTSSGELPATLKRLKIKYCDTLESIAKSFHDNSSLEVIEIHWCFNLKSLPMGIHKLSHLDHFFIDHCPFLDSFPDNGLLPTNLKALTIKGCKKIQALPNFIHSLTSLQKLKILGCPSILSFPEVGFPTNLTSLSIYDTFEGELSKLTSLKKLVIHSESSHLVSFPEVGLPASLTSLNIQNFPDLECISSKCFQFLASLEKLSIERCEKLTSFCQDGLPPSLTSLSIHSCSKFTSFCQDGLPPSLTSLSIYACREFTSFPKVGLPPSLMSLCIDDCEHLTSFPEVGLPPSLTSLSIGDCKNFTSFPKFGISPSLEYLSIRNCEKLTSFQEDGLPLSLLQLHIQKCPLLIERCKGREWFKIAHIPHVMIHHYPFYKLEEKSQ